MAIATGTFGSLAQQLIHAGVVSEAHMTTAQHESKQQKVGVTSYLIEHKMAKAYDLAMVLSQS